MKHLLIVIVAFIYLLPIQSQDLDRMMHIPAGAGSANFINGQSIQYIRRANTEVIINFSLSNHSFYDSIFGTIEISTYNCDYTWDSGMIDLPPGYNAHMNSNDDHYRPYLGGLHYPPCKYAIIPHFFNNGADGGLNGVVTLTWDGYICTFREYSIGGL